MYIFLKKYKVKCAKVSNNSKSKLFSPIGYSFRENEEKHYYCRFPTNFQHPKKPILSLS